MAKNIKIDAFAVLKILVNFPILYLPIKILCIVFFMILHQVTAFNIKKHFQIVTVSWLNGQEKRCQIEIWNTQRV